MNTVTITINGEKYTVPSGQTILTIVHDLGIDTIPTLCHDERLEPFSSCFVCVVEVAGMGKLVPACSTMVTQGMCISTCNERISQARKTALSLLLSNHYANCISPCKQTCPAGVDVQGYIALTSMGKYKEAIELVMKVNPLPASTGRVCVKDCESSCYRNFVDNAPVHINFLKRFASDNVPRKIKASIKQKKMGEIAIIGAGPSGLTCAYYCACEGYSVTIFEKMPDPGGMLRYGIPEYRLPKSILDTEIEHILNTGVTLKTNHSIGSDLSLKEISQKFDAVYLATGADKPTHLDLPSEHSTQGIITGIEFLGNTQVSHSTALPGTVIVIGGGNTAIDAARTALRCGATHIKIIYRRAQEHMPAHREEIQAALDENIEILPLTLPVGITTDNNKITGIECVKMELNQKTDNSRPTPIPIIDSNFFLSCDFLIPAIGQKPNIDFIEKHHGIALSRWGMVQINQNNQATSIMGIFAGGDLVTGPSTVINAIAHGKKGADAIIRYLRTGRIENRQTTSFISTKKISDAQAIEFESVSKQKPAHMIELPMADRKSGFKEVACGFSVQQAESECSRCLECGCFEYYDCNLRKYADEYALSIITLQGQVNKYALDATHPFIILNPNKCINCGKCVRTCNEVLNISALAFVHRGFNSIVKPAMEKTLVETDCVSCGNCIDVCPTGAIGEKLPFKSSGTLSRKNKASICAFCSMNCAINYKVIDDSMFFVSNTVEGIKHSHNRGYVCQKGRFGYRLLHEKPRITHPTIRSDNGHKKVDMKEALQYSGEKLIQVINKYGADAVAVLCSPNCTNEEFYLLQKFCRTVIGSNNIAPYHLMHTTRNEACLDHAVGMPVSTTTLESLNDTNFIVVISDEKMETENFILTMKIKEAVKHGAQLIVISAYPTSLSKVANQWLHSQKGFEILPLYGVIHELIQTKMNAFPLPFDAKEIESLRKSCRTYTAESVCQQTRIALETYQKFCTSLCEDQSNIVFVTYSQNSFSQAIPAVTNFLLLTSRWGKNNNGSLNFDSHANSTGMRTMGAVEQYLPGYVTYNETDRIQKISAAWKTDLTTIFKPGKLSRKIRNREIKAIFIFGAGELTLPTAHQLEDVELLIVADVYKQSLYEKASVLLPLATMLEQSGTYTAFDRRSQQFSPCIKNPCNKENWQLIIELAGFLNKELCYNNISEIREEMTFINRCYQKQTESNQWIGGLDGKSTFNADKKLHLITSIFPPNIQVKKGCASNFDTMFQNVFNNTIKPVRKNP